MPTTGSDAGPITADAVREIVMAETGLSAERLTPDATLAELDISSLDLASIVFEIEDRFDVEIAIDTLTPDLSFSELADRIAALAAQ